MQWGNDAGMAYDEQLAERVREAVADRDDINEKPMFGGLCLLAHGNMFAGVQSDTLMLRVGPGGTRRHSAGRTPGSWTSAAGPCAGTSTSTLRASPPRLSSGSGSS